MTDAELGKFFRSKLASARPKVEPFILARIDPGCDSYFLDVFEPEPIVVEEDSIDALIAIWRRQGLDSLVRLEPELRKIAKALRAPAAKEDETVSDFVYAMY
ncbi:hypothetical protein GWC77_16735 [Paraburkholderia sp. NMBU_R16]|uniref:hypothetical protein n=1 Tax=Paraburkholderia sp. NMBU_R16 TaxID=2698676 RepID=UPI001565FBF2|nr:hypothetical protein [Paraburkholderia sp. NMBU_R16]NRO97570.1 hypothetical protein [Paraburkholderia sp. NMBU_R16]